MVRGEKKKKKENHKKVIKSYKVGLKGKKIKKSSSTRERL